MNKKVHPKSALQETIVKIDSQNDQGTGFFIRPDGYVLTCYHVIQDSPPDSISITWGEKKIAELSIVQTKQELDLALLKIINPTHSFPVPNIAQYECDISITTKFYTFGFSYQKFGFAGYPTDGSIVGRTKYNTNVLFVLKEADITSGISGAPLMLDNEDGTVIGIINASFENYHKVQPLEILLEDEIEPNSLVDIYLKDSNKISFAIPIEIALHSFTELEHLIPNKQAQISKNDEIIHIMRIIEEKKKNLWLIEERRSFFVSSTEIPLTLEKEYRTIKNELDELERRLQ